MMTALEAKDKLGFLSGEIEEPEVNSVRQKQWRKVNSTLISWILNSMTKDIARGFAFATEATSLWEEVKERFGVCNGPRLYELRRSIYSAKKGNNSIAGYYNKIKRLWDELLYLKPGTGGADGEERVMQFLMGLNEDYDNIKNQILTMDPIPTVSKSYSMVSNVEKQRKVHHIVIDSADNMALSVQMAQDFKPASQTTQGYVRNYRPVVKCEYCGKPGHIKAR
ncbi:hypothetical protein LIER_29800 [Lithospermum erythrorhizon]|uniref:Retrotransposon gag domain-containing protein n=1 Tax=Lithospermum erythrorhizon TaxID=34254 RepID=A0AAV3RKB2_LITER